MVAEKKAVVAPTNVMTDKTVGTYSKIGEHFIIKKTPAVTMVAAWIKAETGVGPSMASGNHVCKPIWADLPMAPINNKEQINVKTGNHNLKKQMSNWQKKELMEKQHENLKI